MADKDVLDPPPAAPMNESEQEQAGLYQTALTDYVQQNTLAFITGQRDLSEWDDYVGELEGQNMTTYIDLVNGADRKSTRLNSSHVAISYAVFCLKKKKQQQTQR